MAKAIRIYQTPTPLRIAGVVFSLMGLLTISLLVTRLAQVGLPFWDAAIGFSFGTIFAFVGWVMFASDSITYCEHSREIVFYEQLFRSVETHRIVVAESAQLQIVEDSTQPQCYCLKLDTFVIKDSISKAQAHRLKDRLTKLLCI